MSDSTSRLTTILALFLLLTATAFGAIGCGGDNAEASTGDAERSSESGETTNAGDDATSGEDGADDGSGDDEKNKEEAVPVEVAQLELGAIESVMRFSSNLETENEVEVFSESKRLVRRLLVEEGDRVRKGQLLVKLADEEQRSALAKVESQLAKADREYLRQKRLFEQELISEQAFNDSTYELEQLRISKQDAERELSYTEVRAPIGGTITRRLVNLGDQVQIGQHLFDIVDFDSMVARVFVPERHLSELATGLAARLSSQSSGDRIYTGSVKRISPVVDPKSGTVKVTIDVGSQDGLRPGMYVDVDLVTATRDDAVLVPKRAVVYDNDQMYVFRLGDERRVERVFIEAALADKNFIQPLQGLLAGDEVVIAGQAGLKDKALVRLPGDPKPSDDEDDDATSSGDTVARRASR